MTKGVKRKRAAPDSESPQPARHVRRPRAAQGEGSVPSGERFDGAVSGSLFQDRESPPESAQVEGAIDDWPGIDGTVDDAPSEPADPHRR